MRLVITALVVAVVMGWGLAAMPASETAAYPGSGRWELYLPLVQKPVPPTPTPIPTWTPRPTNTPVPTARPTATSTSLPTATDAQRDACRRAWRAAMDEAWVMGWLSRPSCPLPCEYRVEFAQLMGYWESYCWW